MEEVYRDCPICHSKDIHNIKAITLKMDGIMPDSYFLAKCNRCGFIYANTSATSEDYDNYYVHHNRYSDPTIQMNTSKVIYNAVKDLILQYISVDTSILDVGCSTGGLLKILKEAGYTNVFGLDPAEESIACLRNEGIKGWVGSIYQEPNPETCGKFDIVILSGVLEHLYDVDKAIINIKKYLKVGGKLLCFVPNVLEYASFPYPLPHYINIAHINHFSPSSLTRLMLNNELSLLECTNVAVNFGPKPEALLVGIYENADDGVLNYTKVIEYLKYTDSQKNHCEEVISELCESQRPLIIWGTGNLARMLMETTDLCKCNIKCFVDNDKNMQGSVFCGFNVLCPRQLKDNNGDILVLSMQAYKNIENQIIQMGISNKIVNIMGRQ